MLRRIARGNKKVQDVIKEIDAFPKVEDSYVSTSSFGGLVSLICWIGIALLLYSEINYYYQPVMEYKYSVDNEADRQLELNIDITVAMKCNLIGADVVDIWGNSIGNTKLLQEELVPFELAENQKIFLQAQGALKGLTDKHKALGDMMADIGRKIVPRYDHGKEVEKNACRFHGSIPVHKVEGNFHILSGRSVNIPGMGHAHLQFGQVDKNFSHRIDGLTFGKRVEGMLYALDGEEKKAPVGDYSYQYYIQIVPTNYISRNYNIQTYQYTVQERKRSVDSRAGNHGTAGIAIKYEFSPITATVKEKEKELLPFVTRLLGIVGGIFSTSGLINLIITESYNWLCCCFTKKNTSLR